VFGIVSAAAARRRTFARHITKPYLPPAKTHTITVINLKTGERTVSTTVAPNPVAAKPAKPTPPPAPPTISRPDGVRAILSVVARHWSVGVPALLGAGRSNRLAHPRFAAMVLIKDRLGLSTPAIGRVLGKRDHTTVVSGLRRAATLIENDPEWARRFALVTAELKSAGEP
jgi:hypothetical protein